MNLLLLGGGGREHAIAWKLRKSPLFSQLFTAPGNPGTAKYGSNLPINPNDFEAVKAAAIEHQIDMLIVGPEEPLVRGIADYFSNDPQLSHIKVIGPSAEGARLEGSKAFAKQFMAEFDIPTAAYREFGTTELAAGLDFIATQTPPIVLKADGLAAGKGVLICATIEEAQREFQSMLGGKFGEAGNRVVIEAFLDGLEFSVFALTDGQQYQLFPVAKDYKRIGEGDQGLNTGGMGAVSPVPFVDEVMMQKVEQRIIKPTIAGIQQRGFDYKGFIFFGLISVKGEPFVIEYNCRLGDPETEVIIPRLKNDLLELFVATTEGRLDQENVVIDHHTATTIMLVSGGYPEAYTKGKAITGLEHVDKCLVFHAGTKEEEGQLLTNGGRVIALTCYGTDIQQALAGSLQNAEKVQFEGRYFRRDIGFDL